MNVSYRARPIQLAGLFLTLLVSWLLWSGIYKPILLALGAVSCALTIWLAYRLGVFEDSIPLAILPRLPGYWTTFRKLLGLQGERNLAGRHITGLADHAGQIQCAVIVHITYGVNAYLKQTR